MKEFIEILGNPLIAFLIWQIVIFCYMNSIDRRLTKIEDYNSDMYLMLFIRFIVRKYPDRFKIKDYKDITFTLKDKNGKVIKTFKNKVSNEVDSDRD